MKASRTIVVDGITFSVPPRIQRCKSSKNSGGWRMRYQGERYFADGDGSATESFRAAKNELLARYTGSREKLVGPFSHKPGNLPAGISGPSLLSPAKGTHFAVFRVLLPRFHAQRLTTTVYIAAESTWSQERYDKALAKAIKRREDAVRQYRADAKRALQL